MLSDVQRLQADVVRFRQEQEAVSLDIADSSEFIQSLEVKLQSLGDASAVAESLGDVQFTMCPACYAAIKRD